MENKEEGNQVNEFLQMLKKCNTQGRRNKRWKKTQRQGEKRERESARERDNEQEGGEAKGAKARMSG